MSLDTLPNSNGRTTPLMKVQYNEKSLLKNPLDMETSNKLPF